MPVFRASAGEPPHRPAPNAGPAQPGGTYTGGATYSGPVPVQQQGSPAAPWTPPAQRSAGPRFADGPTEPLREAGVFNAATGGVMYNRVVFQDVTKTDAFKLTLLWDIVF